MAAESLSGGVWYRSRLRILIFPATLASLGWGMLAVTAIEPNARVAHFAMGLPMLVGGWAEARVRFGELRRRYADVLIVVALVNAALETAFFHLSAAASTGVFVTHASLALTAILVAALRWYQGMNPSSLTRSMLVSGSVIMIGIELFIDSTFQPTI